MTKYFENKLLTEKRAAWLVWNLEYVEYYSNIFTINFIEISNDSQNIFETVCIQEEYSKRNNL